MAFRCGNLGDTSSDLKGDIDLCGFNGSGGVKYPVVGLQIPIVNNAYNSGNEKDHKNKQPA